jgi:hypothetical protein
MVAKATVIVQPDVSMLAKLWFETCCNHVAKPVSWQRNWESPWWLLFQLLLLPVFRLVTAILSTSSFPNE